MMANAKAESRRRRHPVSLKLTDDEYQRWRAEADAGDDQLAEWIRNRINAQLARADKRRAAAGG